MRRLHLIVIVLVVFVISTMAIAIYRAREPRYQGRKLTE